MQDSFPSFPFNVVSTQPKLCSSPGTFFEILTDLDNPAFAISHYNNKNINL